MKKLNDTKAVGGSSPRARFEMDFRVDSETQEMEGNGVTVLLVDSGKKKWDLPEDAQAMASRLDFSGKAKAKFVFDRSLSERVVVVAVSMKRPMFHLLEVGRVVASNALGVKPDWVQVDTRSLAPWSADLVDALVSAFVVASHSGPKYQGSNVRKTSTRRVSIHLLVPPGETEVSESQVEKATLLGEGTNLVRQLTVMAGNDLEPARYVKLAQTLAQDAGVKTEFFPVGKLKQMGAGAFLAVVQAAPSRGAGILKLHYKPKNSERKITFVGKGITYDTGGSNLKPDTSMFGMHGDMAGSAVALATVLYAAGRKWPVEVEGYLAIAENLIGPEAYRPNDVVTSLSGKTIEVVHTDAEGRMVLVDTLELASREKPDFMMDFATLTGACVRALGTGYSGAYTNTPGLITAIMGAGRRSGERVWPFPPDQDYGRVLKSHVADIKQCRLTGGPDHIEAGYFLRQFVKAGIPWVHVDLSAEEKEGGLGHVSGEVTGFGVRFAVELTSRILNMPL